MTRCSTLLLVIHDRLKATDRRIWLRFHDSHRQALQPSQRVIEPTFGCASQLDLANSLRKRLQHHLPFEPRKQLTHTHVDAGAKSNMPQGLTLDVIDVRITPLPRIAVCGAQEYQYFPVGFERQATEFGRSGGGAKEVCTGDSKRTASSNAARASLAESARSLPIAQENERDNKWRHLSR